MSPRRCSQQTLLAGACLLRWTADQLVEGIASLRATLHEDQYTASATAMSTQSGEAGLEQGLPDYPTEPGLGWLEGREPYNTLQARCTAFQVRVECIGIDRRNHTEQEGATTAAGNQKAAEEQRSHTLGAQRRVHSADGNPKGSRRKVEHLVVAPLTGRGMPERRSLSGWTPPSP